MSAIFKREFKAYFASPLGYVIVSALAFFSAIFFSYMYTYGYADVAYIFSNMLVIVMFAVPILTMRLMSEERKQKTDQALFTAPVGLTSIVMGKFLAALSIFALGFAPTLIYQTVFSFKVSLNWLLYLSDLLGVLLYGAALIAIGLFLSSLTESQVVAAVLGIVVSLLVGLMDNFASMINNEFLTGIISYISFNGRYEAFANGIIDFSNIVFFVSVAAAFIFLTVRSLEKKRWA